MLLGLVVALGVASLITYAAGGDVRLASGVLRDFEVVAWLVFLYRSRSALRRSAETSSEVLIRFVVGAGLLAIYLVPALINLLSPSVDAWWASRIGMQMFLIGTALYVWQKSKAKAVA